MLSLVAKRHVLADTLLSIVPCHNVRMLTFSIEIVGVTTGMFEDDNARYADREPGYQFTV